MLHYRRKQFTEVYRLLRQIRRKPRDIKALLRCQVLLLDEIMHAESKIVLHRKLEKNVRISLGKARQRDESRQFKKRLETIRATVDRYQQLLYIWRCFGDGIAFIYLDRHAIKQAYYETETGSVKQSAGFISGKEGLAGELHTVLDAARAGVPSVLVDLTNSIRHGDVCLLGASDPHLIEVKSSERLNQRGRRQASHIQTLHEFYESDQAKDLRGYKNVHRIAAHSKPRCYVRQLNECISAAAESKISLVTPEPGLHYIAIYGSARSALKKMFNSLSIEEGAVYFLNEFKNGRAWSPYWPFTLAFRNEHHLYDFITGRLFLFVIHDIAVLRKGLAKLGLENVPSDNPDYPLRYRDPSNDATGGISIHLLRRIGLEFLSPKWILALHRHALSSAAVRLQSAPSPTIPDLK